MAYILLKSPSGDPANLCITPIPWDAVTQSPVWVGIEEPTLGVLQQAYERGKNNIVIIPDPAPQPILIEPDWEALKNRALGGDLYPIFQRLTMASLASDANTISTARGDITDAILTVRVETALASGFNLLTQVGGYVFRPEEKDMWKSAVDELHFSSLVYLP